MEAAYEAFRSALALVVRAVMTDRGPLPAHSVVLITAAKALLTAAAAPLPGAAPDTAQRLVALREQLEQTLLGLLRTVAAQAKVLAADGAAPAGEMSTCLAEIDRTTRDWAARHRAIEADHRLTVAARAPAAAAPRAYTALSNVASTLVLLVAEAVEPIGTAPPAQIQELCIGVVKQTKAMIELWKISDDVHDLVRDDDGAILTQAQRLLLDTKLLATTLAVGADLSPVRCQIVRAAAGLAELVVRWIGAYYAVSLQPALSIVHARAKDVIARLTRSPAPSPAPSSGPATPIDTASFSSGSSLSLTAADRRVSAPASVGQGLMTARTQLPVLAVFALTCTHARQPPLSAKESDREQPLTLADAAVQRPKASSARSSADPARGHSSNDDVLEVAVRVHDSPSTLRDNAKKKNTYDAKTLRKWSAKFFAVAHADFHGAEHAAQALSFSRGDLIAVYDSSDLSLWQGANVETDAVGYFPCQFVTTIDESAKLLQTKEKRPTILPAADVLEIEQKRLQDIDAIKESIKIKVPPPDKSGMLRLQIERKKWVETHCILKDHTLFFSKPSPKRSNVPVLVSLRLPGMMIRPAMQDEVSKGEIESCFVVVDPKNAEQYVFTANDKGEKTNWAELLTLSCLSVSTKDVNRNSYHFNSDASKTLRGRSLQGIDSLGRMSEVEAGAGVTGTGSGREKWMEGLTEEQIANVQKVMPSKKTVETLSGVKSKRSSLFF